ncbi:uncharacterized protein ColSpa_11490 [Colletotrichum spaethianum]|uniref:Uncharacterized protein n=1 Tax=Colletotrichum spaethianum TaxID=700344 RepID=A0AA37PFN0_9PEZI|nr:uncharacterized protein ColSpa_11490 [Colletotrichum spaethianum]GKT51309.1 hypothetical protein ColSpa_11490 [Colletotrichum spaethianum]
MQSSDIKDTEDYEMFFTLKDVQKAVDKAVAAVIAETKSEAMKKAAMKKADLNNQTINLKDSHQAYKAKLFKHNKDLGIRVVHSNCLARQLEVRLTAAKVCMKALQDQLDATQRELRITQEGLVDAGRRGFLRLCVGSHSE